MQTSFAKTCPSQFRYKLLDDLLKFIKSYGLKNLLGVEHARMLATMSVANFGPVKANDPDWNFGSQCHHMFFHTPATWKTMLFLRLGGFQHVPAVLVPVPEPCMQKRNLPTILRHSMGTSGECNKPLSSSKTRSVKSPEAKYTGHLDASVRHVQNFAPRTRPANPAYSSNYGYDHTTKVNIEFVHINAPNPWPSSVICYWCHTRIERFKRIFDGNISAQANSCWQRRPSSLQASIFCKKTFVYIIYNYMILRAPGGFGQPTTVAESASQPLRRNQPTNALRRNQPASHCGGIIFIVIIYDVYTYIFFFKYFE